MTDPKTPAPPLQIQIELDPETAQGSYVNMAMVNHTEAEFTIDFIYVQPQAPKAKVRARVISSPKHTKRLLAALTDSLRQFEAKYGVVDVSGPGAPPGQILN
ncbi:MAG: DUF3467 domain-containing protein [Deltaproteobacteria bacterium]|nr:DUF3467 domain-containing protein [Deltaproteobacteria bacterium]